MSSPVERKIFVFNQIQIQKKQLKETLWTPSTYTPKTSKFIRVKKYFQNYCQQNDKHDSCQKCSACKKILYLKLSFKFNGKNSKSDIFWSHSNSKINLSKQYFRHKRVAPRNIIFKKKFGHPAKPKLF